MRDPTSAYGPRAWLNTIQWQNNGDLKIDVYLRGIRDGTHRWKGNIYLDILVSWILDQADYTDNTLYQMSSAGNGRFK